MMRALRLMIVFITLVVLTVSAAAPVQAQEQDPQQTPRDLFLFTRYPVQEAIIGDPTTIRLTLGTDTTPQIVRLTTRNAPDGWNVSFRGDGKVIQAVYVYPKNEASVDFRVEPPKDVAAGTYRLTIVASGETREVTLPIELILKDKETSSTGLTLDVDLPRLRGTSGTTFRYNITVKNESDQETPVSLIAEAPRGFQIDFRFGGQSITSIPFGPNESKSLSLEVRPLPDIPAGSYEIPVLVQGGEYRATTTLVAELTGQPQLVLTTPDGRLSGEARIGEKTAIKLVVRNTGSAPARNIQLSASPPIGWTVEFEPQTISELANNQTVEVTANIQPSNQAIAGDYVVNLTARTDEGASDSAEFRVTVLTSTVWGLVGVALIAIAVVGVGMAVMRFGRR
ncbi:NEW3 domain-containing protein [Roseiflexus sp.]|uniref:NEW3 domain-containing protein n=1 Tax=Roseiflexus sp. TaxID=2562120 RepID=UPI002585F62A|nr:NEW3 domain-containing protein [Roseiflexus sp.]